MTLLPLKSAGVLGLPMSAGPTAATSLGGSERLLARFLLFFGDSASSV